MTQPQDATVRFTTLSEMQRRAVKRWGRKNYDKRVVTAEAKAAEVKDDLTCFPEDKDRDRVEVFVAYRFMQICISVSPKNYQKIKKMPGDHLFCIMLKMIEKGRMI